MKNTIDTIIDLNRRASIIAVWKMPCGQTEGTLKAGRKLYRFSVDKCKASTFVSFWNIDAKSRYDANAERTDIHLNSDSGVVDRKLFDARKEIAAAQKSIFLFRNYGVL